MTEVQTVSLEKNTNVGVEDEDLFDALVSTTGTTLIRSRNLMVTDEDTKQTVWLKQGEGGTMVIADFFRMKFVEGKKLTMGPQEPDEAVFSATTGTPSGKLRRGKAAPEFITPRPPPSPGIARILARAPEELRRALEWEKEHGDLFDNLDELLGGIFEGIEMTWDEWYAIIDAPYDPY